MKNIIIFKKLLQTCEVCKGCLMGLLLILLSLPVYAGTIAKDELSMEVKEMGSVDLHSKIIAETPNEIIDRLKAAYKSLKTFKTHGTVTMDVEANGVRQVIQTDFDMILKKPNQYLISWTQKMSAQEFTQEGAVWSDGSKSFLYMGAMNAYSAMRTDEMALGAATGISAGVALNMPSIFLSVFKEPSSIFDRVKTWILEGSEVVGNEECFVISGSSSSSKKETLWVSKLNYLIKKSAYFLESYQGEESKIEITDEQIEEVAKSMGLSNAQEARQKIREDIEKAKASSTTGETKGTCVELYGDIFFPDLNEGDFQFKLPNAVALKDSLFGGMLGK